MIFIKFLGFEDSHLGDGLVEFFIFFVSDFLLFSQPDWFGSVKDFPIPDSLLDFLSFRLLLLFLVFFNFRVFVFILFFLKN